MYDPKCLELAKHFLGQYQLSEKTEAYLQNALAKEIQATVESFIKFEEIGKHKQER